MEQDAELKMRLEALERENRDLKSVIGRGGVQRKTVRYSIGDYKGHPTITFEVSGRHLTMGVRKAAIVLRCVEQIRAFVVEHKGEVSDWEVIRENDRERPSDGDDLQI